MAKNNVSKSRAGKKKAGKASARSRSAKSSTAKKSKATKKKSTANKKSATKPVKKTAAKKKVAKKRSSKKTKVAGKKKAPVKKASAKKKSTSTAKKKSAAKQKPKKVVKKSAVKKKSTAKKKATKKAAAKKKAVAEKVEESAPPAPRKLKVRKRPPVKLPIDRKKDELNGIGKDHPIIIKKTPFNKSKLAMFRKLLLAERDRHVEDIAFLSRSARNNSGDLSNYSKHMADQGTDNFTSMTSSGKSTRRSNASITKPSASVKSPAKPSAWSDSRRCPTPGIRLRRKRQSNAAISNTVLSVLL